MKKIIALALSLMMVLCAVSALADTTVTMKDAFDLKFDDLPGGYQLTVVEDTDMTYMAVIVDDAVADKPSMSLTIAFNDEWYGVNSWNDITADDLAAVKDSFYEVAELDEGDIIFTDSYTSDNGIPMLLAIEKNGALAALYTIYNSHEIELDIFPATEDGKVDMAQVDAIITFLNTLEIVPAK